MSSLKPHPFLVPAWSACRSGGTAVIAEVGDSGSPAVSSQLSPNHLCQTVAMTSGVMGAPAAISAAKSSSSGAYSSAGAPRSRTPSRPWALRRSLMAAFRWSVPNVCGHAARLGGKGCVAVASAARVR